MADQDSFCLPHQEEPGAVDRTEAYPVRGGLVDRLGGDPQESSLPGEIPGHGLLDPNIEQGLPGSDPPTGV